MNQDLINGTRHLAKNNIRHLHVEPGRRVEVVSGSIWITQDGDLRDIVLQSGEGFDFDRAGDALLSAFADSRYLVLDAVATHRTGPMTASGIGSAITSMPSSRRASASSFDARPRMPRSSTSP